jgi:hypothetical protein
MRKPKLITPQVGILPKMKTYIVVALKLLSAPRSLVSHTKKPGNIFGAAMPTCATQKPIVAAMSVGEPICKTSRTNLSHKYTVTTNTVAWDLARP